jgi:hypothetical protein
MKSTLRPAFAANPATDTKSGVFMSCSPRRRPVAAMTSSIPGNPHNEMLR